MWRYILACLFVLALTANVQAATLVSADGAPNATGTHPLEVDTDRVITIASDATLTISGATKLLVEAATTSDTITAAESGKVFAVDCATVCEFELPAAVAGLYYTFVATDNDAVFSVDPNGTDVMYAAVGAKPLDAGDKITSPGATGDSITVVSTATSYWVVSSQYGTWTDGGQ